MANNVLKDKEGNILNTKIPRYEKRLFRILWKNTSNKMTNGTEIILSSDNYDMLIWIFATSSSGSKNNVISACLKGNNCILSSSTVTSNNSVRRSLNYVNDNKYIASSGYDSSNNVDENNAIPIQCIGYKF